MPQYRYSPLAPGPDSIRLLRLLPHEDEKAPIQCQLLNYSLYRSRRGTHPYEALSYVWGGSEKPRSISIDQHDLPITTNLHAALSQLRDPFVERILWVDAICINQGDLEERGLQVQSMAKIYSKASHVVVWLGVAADNSDHALEQIRVATEKQSANLPSDKEETQLAVLTLLQRPWFRRIWILQEVAMARDVLIMCGSVEIDGYAFCLGLKSLEISYEAHPDLESLIRSVTYLIRGAISRPRQATTSLSTVPTNSFYLSELMDMYHSHEATERHDKVYALLGMSVDGSRAATLSPDYKIPWKQLLQRLVDFLLHEDASVTECGMEAAAIKSKGCIIGRVASVQNDITWNDIQHMHITSQDTPKYLGYEEEWGARYTLQPSAKYVRQGDLVCLLYGASKPMIVRPCKDYFDVITVAVTSMEDVPTNKRNVVKWPALLRLKEIFLSDILLVWDWNKSQEAWKDREYETSIGRESHVLENSAAELEEHLERFWRLESVAQVLLELNDYRGAKERLLGALEGYKGVVGEKHLRTLTCMERLALIYEKQGGLRKAKEVYEQLVQKRMRIQVAHPSTLRSVNNLQSTHRYVENQREKRSRRKRKFRGSRKKLETMIYILKKKLECDQITNELAIPIVTDMDDKVVGFLLGVIRDSFRVTEEFVIAAARNKLYGVEVMTLLLDRRENEIQITGEVLKAAVRNLNCGIGLVALLLDRRESEIQITGEVLEAVVSNWMYGVEMMELIFKRKEDGIQITEEVLKVVASNESQGTSIMALLLDHKGNEIQITEDVLEAVVSYQNYPIEMTELVFKRKGEGIQITEKVAKAAIYGIACNKRELIQFLRCGKVGSIRLTQEADKMLCDWLAGLKCRGGCLQCKGGSR